MPWRTPQSAPVPQHRPLLQFPDTEEWFAVYAGALVELTKDYNWSQSPGGLSVAETVEIWRDKLWMLSYS